MRMIVELIFLGVALASVNDFSSKAVMESNGWVFNWNSQFAFLTPDILNVCDGAKSTWYCGFEYPEDGKLSLTLSGSGILTMSFANVWSAGVVMVTKNGIFADFALPGNHKTVNMIYEDGDVLAILDGPGVIGIEYVHFQHISSDSDVCIPTSFAHLDDMTNNGWRFDWSDAHTFVKPSTEPDWCDGGLAAGKVNYCGYRHPGNGEVSLPLRGVGTAKVTWGNGMDGTASFPRVVTLYKNGVQVAKQNNRDINVVTDVPFENGDVIAFQETLGGVIIISDIEFTCQGGGCGVADCKNNQPLCESTMSYSVESTQDAFCGEGSGPVLLQYQGTSCVQDSVVSMLWTSITAVAADNLTTVHCQHAREDKLQDTAWLEKWLGSCGSPPTAFYLMPTKCDDAWTLDMTDSIDLEVGLSRVASDAQSFASSSASCTVASAATSDGFTGTGIHCFPHINDGLYGNNNAWGPSIAGSDFVGVIFDEPLKLAAIGLSRDRSGQFVDKYLGLKVLSFTSDISAGYADSVWTDIGDPIYLSSPSARHIYRFAPRTAAAVRFLLEENDVIDELELFFAAVNECDASPCHKDAICTDTPSSYTCACKPGFTGNGEDCQDNNECADAADNNCDTQATCINTPGSFTCQCLAGMSGSGLDTDCFDVGCPPNSAGDSVRETCTCVEGFEGAVGATTEAPFYENTCIEAGCTIEWTLDIPEWDAGTFKDDPNTCTSGNEVAHGFECGLGCVASDKKFSGAQHYCVKGVWSPGTPTCTQCYCDNGVAGDHEGCLQSTGACVSCNDGYKLTAPPDPNQPLLGCFCEDIDECETSPCTATATCNNTIGSFECVCPIGFGGTGLATEDNSCAPVDCPPHSTGTNVAEGCTCMEGYSGAVEASMEFPYYTGGCLDVDECALMGSDYPCDPNGACQNTAGSFVCSCREGFTGNGAKVDGCEDIDECTQDNVCGEHMTCKNTPGSFECSCNDGYFKASAGECVDIDECAAAVPPCDGTKNLVCANTAGSYQCDCDQGYEKSGDVCEPLGCTIADMATDDKITFGSCTNGQTLTHDESCALTCKTPTDKLSGSQPSCTLGEFNPGNTVCSKCACINGIAGDHEGCGDDNGACKSCNDGYKLVGDPSVNGGLGCYCDDINECELEVSPCDANAACTNSDGSYSCACAEGYEGDGVTCTAKGCEVTQFTLSDKVNTGNVCLVGAVLAHNQECELYCPLGSFHTGSQPSCSLGQFSSGDITCKGCECQNGVAATSCSATEPLACASCNDNFVLEGTAGQAGSTCTAAPPTKAPTTAPPKEETHNFSSSWRVAPSCLVALVLLSL